MTGVSRILFVLTSLVYDLCVHLLGCLAVVATLLIWNPEGIFTVYEDLPGRLELLGTFLKKKRRNIPAFLPSYCCHPQALYSSSSLRSALPKYRWPISFRIIHPSLRPASL